MSHCSASERWKFSYILYGKAGNIVDVQWACIPNSQVCIQHSLIIHLSGFHSTGSTPNKDAKAVVQCILNKPNIWWHSWPPLWEVLHKKKPRGGKRSILYKPPTFYCSWHRNLERFVMLSTPFTWRSCYLSSLHFPKPSDKKSPDGNEVSAIIILGLESNDHIDFGMHQWQVHLVKEYIITKKQVNAGPITLRWLHDKSARWFCLQLCQRSSSSTYKAPPSRGDEQSQVL